MADTHLVFTLRNDLAALSEVSAQIEEALEPLGLAPRDAYAIDLVLDEVLSNTIKYGYEDGAEHQIRVELIFTPETVTVVLEDDARAFDPLLSTKPELDSPLEERPVGGLGLHLTRKVMDECEYARENGRNRLVMKKQKSVGPVG